MLYSCHKLLDDAWHYGTTISFWVPTMGIMITTPLGLIWKDEDNVSTPPTVKKLPLKGVVESAKKLKGPQKEHQK